MKHFPFTSFFIVDVQGCRGRFRHAAAPAKFKQFMQFGLDVRWQRGRGSLIITHRSGNCLNPKKPFATYGASVGVASIPLTYTTL